MPVMNDSVRMCQIWTTWKYISTASVADVAIWRYCEASSVTRRSWRSASTPPTSENRMMGSCCRKASRPRKNGECVSDRTSQFCATICIHVPMLEVHAPNHCTRKSRYENADSVRMSVRVPNEGVDAVSAEAWASEAGVGGFGAAAVVTREGS